MGEKINVKAERYYLEKKSCSVAKLFSGFKPGGNSIGGDGRVRRMTSRCKVGLSQSSNEDRGRTHHFTELSVTDGALGSSHEPQNNPKNHMLLIAHILRIKKQICEDKG